MKAATAADREVDPVEAPRGLAAVNPRQVVIGVVVLVALAVPLLRGGFPLYLGTQALIWAVSAVGLGFLVSQAGLVSLGHAAFLGLGAYGAALLGLEVTASPFVTLTLPVLLAVAYAALTGPLALRGEGLVFLMITLAFAQLLYAVSLQWTSVTSGTNGLSGVPVLTGVPTAQAFYVLVAALLAIVLLVLDRLSRAPFGRALAAARQDEAKTLSLGYPVSALRYAAYLVSAGVTALGGALQAHHRGFVSPQDLYWVTSGVLVVMVLFGGVRRRFGAVLGAVVYVTLESWLSARTQYVELVIGALLIAVVLWRRQGGAARAAG